MANFYFFYSWVLLLIPLWLIAVYGYYHYQTKRIQWDKFIDKPLQGFVISGLHDTTSSPLTTFWQYWLTALAGVLTLFALSGPSFQQQKVPLFEDQEALVIALDLSTSMLANDIKPSRLQRAKFTIMDLLKQRKTGYTALIVFAGDAFAVTPLTNDTENILTQLNFMTPEVMPAQGSRPDKAIEKAISLLSNADYLTGDILLITDGLVSQSATEKSAKLARDKGYQLTILGMATTRGSSIPRISSFPGAFHSANTRELTDIQGRLIISKLDSVALQRVADVAGGYFFPASLSNNISKLMHLLGNQANPKDKHFSESDTFNSHVNSGVWFIFPLIAIVLLLFRRGVVVGVVLLLTIQADRVYANNLFDWDSLWLTPQQRANKLLRISASHTASLSDELKDELARVNLLLDKHEESNHTPHSSNNSLPTDKVQWKAAIAYRLQNYIMAAQLYAHNDDVENLYNQGNSLVKSHQYEKAKQAYEHVLKKQPDHRDAQYNLSLVDKKLQELNPPQLAENKKLDSSLSKTSDNELTTNEQKKEARQQSEQQAFDKQWLNSIADDPSGLWRRKFLYQYNKHGRQQEAQQW